MKSVIKLSYTSNFPITKDFTFEQKVSQKTYKLKYVFRVKRYFSLLYFLKQHIYGDQIMFLVINQKIVINVHIFRVVKTKKKL